MRSCRAYISSSSSLLARSEVKPAPATGHSSGSSFTTAPQKEAGVAWRVGDRVPVWVDWFGVLERVAASGPFCDNVLGHNCVGSTGRAKASTL